MKLVTVLLTLLVALSISVAPALAAELMIVGNDEKVGWDDAKPVFSPPGKDTISIIDIGSDPLAPRVIANLQLMNSIFGPPVNLAITPDEQLAIVANSMTWVQEGSGWKPTPDNKLYVIDLKASPPKHIGTVEIGKQPSGLSINSRGDLALVANRADPDGKRALAVKFPGHKIAVLDVSGPKVTYSKYDMPVGQWPYNIDVSPNGKLAITADNDNGGSSDGHVDTVSIIDLEATPPRVIDRVVVGDAPEGFAISPTGEIAVAILLNGSAGVPKNAWFANKNGKVVVLRIDGKKVTRTQEIEVGGLPEGVVFSADGRYICVGNYTTRDLSILKVENGTVTDTGKRVALPGSPASMRGRAR